MADLRAPALQGLSWNQRLTAASTTRARSRGRTVQWRKATHLFHDSGLL